MEIIKIISNIVAVINMIIAIIERCKGNTQEAIYYLAWSLILQI